METFFLWIAVVVVIFVILIWHKTEVDKQQEARGKRNRTAICKVVQKYFPHILDEYEKIKVGKFGEIDTDKFWKVYEGLYEREIKKYCDLSINDSYSIFIQEFHRLENILPV